MEIKNQKVRVLQILLGLGIGGAENYVRYVCKHIDTSRFQFDVLVHNDRREYEKDIISKGGRIIHCPYSLNLVKYVSNFKNILKKYGPYDILHSHLTSAGLHMFLAAKAGVPIRIVHCHANDILELAQSRFKISRLVSLKIMNRLTQKYATAGIGVSQQAVRRYGENWTTDSRWRILYCGIDLAPFAESVDPKIIRTELGIPTQAFVVGHVGRIDHLKNHTFMIDILEELIKVKPNTHLLLIGNGLLREQIEEKAIRLGLQAHITFAGWRNDVPRLLKGAMDVFLLPSLSEGLPMVLMETQAAGLPAVVSNVVTNETDVIPSLISRLSVNDPPEKWARKLIDILEGNKKINPPLALKVMEEGKFNIKKSCDDLMKLYHKLMENEKYN